MEFKFTINTDNLNDPDSIEEAVADFKVLIRFLQRANPNYYLIGNMLDEQLKQQLEQDKREDPKQQMIAKWNELWLKVSGYSKEYTSVIDITEDTKQKIKNFYDQIGEAMGPVCYAGYQVRTSTNANNIGMWVVNCIEYYEEHWEM